MSRRARIVLYGWPAAAVFVLGLTAVRYLDRPVRFDEILWPTQAKAILAHGIPKLSFAESRLQHVPDYYGYDAYYGMWHPPLYQYTLAAAVAAAGDHAWVYRGVGLLCLLASLGVVWRLTADILGGARPSVRAMPIALAVLSPLVAEGILFLDIDNTTLMLSMALVLWRFLRPGDPYAPGRIVELSLLLCLTMLSKLTTPFILIASLALYALIGPRPVRGLLAVAAAGAAGVALFAALYWIYCRALSYPPAFMFDFSYVGKKGLYGSVKTLKSVLFAVRWNVVWFSPIMTLLFGSVVARRALHYLRRRRTDPVDLLVIFSSAMFVAYGVVGALWGKYTVPAAFFGAAAVGIELARVWPAVRIDRPRALLGALGVIAIAAAVLPVPFVRTPGVDSAGGVIALSLDPRNVSAVVTALLALAIAAGAARGWISGRGRWASGEAALAAAVFVTAPITTARVVIPSYDRGPFRPFMDHGFQPTVDFLNAAAPPDAAILAPKDIGYYFRGRFYGLEGILSNGGLPLTERVARRSDVRYIVDSTKYPSITDPSFFDRIDIARVETIGDFRVYVKR